MNKYLLFCLVLMAQTTQAETCEELGDITGLYSQSLAIPGVFSQPNGGAVFEKISKNRYYYVLKDDLDIDGAPMEIRGAEIKLVTKEKECTFVDPIYPEPNITRIISRSSNDKLIIKNRNSANSKVVMVLSRESELHLN